MPRINIHFLLSIQSFFCLLIISNEIIKNVTDMDNDIIKNIINSINSKECENIVPIIPPENQATLIFPKISDERLS